MITEDYVSFETAKLLNEKGFDENTPVNYFVGDDKPRGCVVGEMIYHKRGEEDAYLIACPTLQMTMKWLREIHKLEVRSIYDYDKDSWWGNIDPMFDETDENSDIYQKALRFDYQGKSYEEAAESAIKYALENLI